ncbi:MAG: hypothetical protein OEP48_04550 [Betaproteobacteria bacterium]|nr:hypothetical protein [Betaproteobacteria bacterium]
MNHEDAEKNGRDTNRQDAKDAKTGKIKRGRFAGVAADGKHSKRHVTDRDPAARRRA